MWVSIDFCILPLGVDVSISPYIAACLEIIDKSGLGYEIGPNGTAIEGDWQLVFDCVKACHIEVHRLGSDRVYTSLRINTRTDKQQSFTQKVPRVKSLLSDKSH